MMFRSLVRKNLINNISRNSLQFNKELSWLSLQRQLSHQPSFFLPSRLYSMTRVSCQNNSGSNNDSMKSDTNSEIQMNNQINQQNTEKFPDIPGVKSPGEKYAMVYTCKVCETRSIKKISKQSYHHGCVLVRCPGCKNLHLIADHLGIFEDKGWTIESYLSQHGEQIKKVDNDDGVFELTKDDILGTAGKTLETKKEE